MQGSKKLIVCYNLQAKKHPRSPLVDTAPLKDNLPKISKKTSAPGIYTTCKFSSSPTPQYQGGCSYPGISLPTGSRALYSSNIYVKLILVSVTFIRGIFL